MSDVSGTVEKGFERVREGFAEAQAKDEGGAQLCIYRNGKKVVDLWGGHDKIRNRPYTDRTIAVMMSCSKGVVATMAHTLSERGLLDLDAPVDEILARVRPGRKGRRAGLIPPFPSRRSEQLRAGERRGPARTARLAALHHGARKNGAALETGHRLYVPRGDLRLSRRRSDPPRLGQDAGPIPGDEIAKPLALDLWIGLPADKEERVAPHFSDRPTVSLEQWRELFKGLGIDMQSRVGKAMMHMITATDEAIEMINRPEGHAADICSEHDRRCARTGADVRSDDRRSRWRATSEARDNGAGAQAADRRTEGPASLQSPNADPQRLALGYELNRGIEPMLGPGSFGHAGAGGAPRFCASRKQDRGGLCLQQHAVGWHPRTGRTLAALDQGAERNHRALSLVDCFSR